MWVGSSKESNLNHVKKEYPLDGQVVIGIIKP